MKMTNEKQTQNRGRLLVIDDNPNYVLNAVRAGRVRGYEVDVAFDLKDAMTYLQSRSYTGIITDLQFCERGVNKSEILRTNTKDLSDLERDLLAPFDSLYDQVETNSELREKIARELATHENAMQLVDLQWSGGEWGNIFFGRLTTQEGIREDNLKSPAMGYEIIKYTQDHDIPLIVVTSVGHGQHCIPALFQTGLVNADSLIRHESARFLERERVEKEKAEEEKNIDGTLKGDELKAEYRKCDGVFNSRLARLNAIVLDRAILVMQEGKEQHTYNLAIDMFEGKIDETRPYKVN